MKKVLLVLLSSLIFHLSSSLSLAATDFSTSFDSTYTFSESGVAQIEHQIDITNNLAHLYTTEYSLAIQSGKIDNIQTVINTFTETPKIDQTSSTTNIHIPVTRPVIGKDQVTSIKITYESPSFAEPIGPTYTIQLPRSAKGNETENFVRRVKVPVSFPEHSMSTIAPQSILVEDDYRVYTFVGSGNQTIKLLLGEEVTYHLELKYDIKNTAGNSGFTEIALPPDTSYQKVRLHKIEPKPEEIVVDEDGNYLARYQLSYLEKKSISADLYVTVRPTPTYPDPSTARPTKSTTFWEHPRTLTELAEQLKTPKNIYSYLVENFSYDFSRVTSRDRLGAEAALASPTSAICTEFTDTFIALARSLRIPSRAIIGYAYSTDPNLRPQGASQDILHAYPEYFDSEANSWIAVDPTWGNTTGGVDYFGSLDFSHITFVRLGQESAYPLPAGSYRSQDSLEQQIKVQVAGRVPEDTEDLIPPKTVTSTNEPTLQNHKLLLTCIIILCVVLFLKFLLPWLRSMQRKH